MSLTPKQRAARYRARKRGEEIPLLRPGVKKGFKQAVEHVEKRKRFGSDHHAWVGDKASTKTGRTRAERQFRERPCQLCGEFEKRIDRHHIDGNTVNNDPKNIQFLCRKCHMKEDGRLERFKQLARTNQAKAVAARWA